MDNPKVDIYIETSVHGPSSHGGRWMYLLEYALSTGEPATVWKIGSWEFKKENALALEAFVEALSRLRMACVVDLHTDCRYLRSAMECGWLDAWHAAGWKRAGGKEVSHRELWEKIFPLYEKHLIFVAAGEANQYCGWMQLQMKQQND